MAQGLAAVRAAVAASRAGVLASALAFAAGLGMAEVDATVHSWVVLASALAAFPAAVWVSYTLAGIRVPPPWFPAASWASVALTLAGLAAGAAWSRAVGSALIAAGLAAGALLGVEAARATARRPDARLSYALGTAASAAAALYALLYPLARGDPGDVPVAYALGLLAAYPLPLIHAITVHSLPSTFKDSPPRRAALLAGAAGAAAGPLYLATESALLLTAVMLALYPYTTRAYRAPSYLAQLARLKPGPAREGRAFFASSHIATAGLAAASAAAVALETLGPGYPRGPLGLVHLLAAGFTASHVYIHAPMMLPTILALPAGRRFTLAALSVYLAAASGALWPHASKAALGMAGLAWLLAIPATIRPPSTRSRRPGGPAASA